MDFLKYLDVLIGLTIVMILLSPAVTAVTQVFMFAFNRRSRFLRKGLEALIQQLDGAASGDLQPVMTPAAARTIAGAVLLHPMIRKAEFSLGWFNRLVKKMNWKWLSRDHSGEVVEREELTRILLEFAAGEGAGKLADENARKALIECLKVNGISDPAKALADIRSEAQRLEKEQPDTAAHVRASEAIITAAKSDFVGRINAWFDQTMDRITQRYASQARLVTIGGALLVAFAIQLDSLDLLRRLSVDSKFRSSLLDEARADDARIEQLASVPVQQNQDELETLQAARDEIQQNLAKLRAPDMAILPDHFIWQRVPQASLVRNPLWRAPYPSRFELIAGSSSFAVSPRWRRDALQDLKEAVDDAKAPVSASIQPGEAVLLLTANQPGGIELFDASGRPMLTPVVELARACVASNPDWPERINASLYLVLDDREQPEFTLETTRENALSALEKALKPNSAIALSSKAGQLCITALEPRVRSIRLLYDRADPFSNVLDNTGRITRAGAVPEALLKNRKVTLLVDGTPVDDFNGSKTSSGDRVTVRPYRADALVLTSHTLGKLELRYAPGKPDSNILSGTVDAEWKSASIWPLQPAFWGIVLSWLLLSLGAPFWYDALKDLLKLRSSLASKEEGQRKDRQSETAAPPAKA